VHGDLLGPGGGARGEEDGGVEVDRGRGGEADDLGAQAGLVAGRDVVGRVAETHEAGQVVAQLRVDLCRL